MKSLGPSLLKSICLVGSIGLMGTMSAGATAVTYNLGTLTSSLTNRFLEDPVGAIDDIFTFSIAPADSGAAIGSSLFTVVNPLGGNLTHISGFTGVLLDGSLNPLGPSDVLTPTSSQDFLFSGSLTPGNYAMEVTGTADGQLGGIYTVSMAALPVPEVSTALSVIAGLGMLALVTRRRRFS